jgi:hypothetical protein
VKLTLRESQFLTALAREQNQSGCRGPAHELLRKYAYSETPREGPGSLAFSYEAVPLTSLLLRNFKSIQEIDDFLRREDRIPDPVWPWSSAEEYFARLEEAKREALAKNDAYDGAARVG